MSILNSFSNFFSRGKGTDNWTQPISVDDGATLRYMNGLTNSIFGSDKANEQWVTNSNNEYKIYNTTPEVKLVIDKGASLFSNGRWQVIDKKTGEIIDEHALYDLLKAPNPYEDKNLFLRGVYTSWALYGNSFTYLNYALDSSDIPSMMNNLNTQQVKLKRSNKYIKQDIITNIVEAYILTKQGEKNKILDTFEPKHIVHFRDYNSNDPLLGASRLTSMHMPISNIRAGRGYVNADYTKKGAMGILSPEVLKDGGGVLPTNQKHVEDLEKQYSETTHGTGDKQSKVIISKMPIKYTPISSALRDHQIHEEIDLDFKRLIDLYELNEGLFSFQKQSTFNNQENGEKQAYQNGIIPIANMFTSALNDKLDLVDKMGIYVKLDYSHVSCFQVDETDRATEMKIKIEAMEKLVGLGYSREEAARIMILED